MNGPEKSSTCLVLGKVEVNVELTRKWFGRVFVTFIIHHREDVRESSLSLPKNILLPNV